MRTQSMSTNTNIGLIFETQLMKELSSFGVDIIHEKDLMKMFGWNASGIDIVLFTKQGFIAIQAKYRRSRRRENHGISNFLKSLQYIREIYDKQYNCPFLYGLWVSRAEPFDDNKELLAGHKVHWISHFSSMDTLINNCKTWIATQTT